MPRISPDEKREKLLKERGKLDAQLRALDAQQKETQRKRDTRRKVIAGAIALEHLERNENDPFSVKLRELLHTLRRRPVARSVPVPPRPTMTDRRKQLRQKAR